jgi:hypothetical protein
MKLFLQILDIAMRLASIAVLGLFVYPIFLIVTVLMTDSGTVEAYRISLLAFVIGNGVLIVLAILAVRPQFLERCISGPPQVGKFVARIPTYFIVIGWALLMLRMLWNTVPPSG